MNIEQENLKQRLRIRRSGISPAMIPEGVSLEEYQKAMENILSGKKLSQIGLVEQSIIGKWAAANVAPRKEAAAIDKSIARHNRKEEKILYKRAERIRTNRPLTAKQVAGRTERELLHHFDKSELLQFYERGDDLNALAKIHGQNVPVGAEALKGKTARTIVGAPRALKAFGALAGGVATANLVNDVLFDEPLPTPIVLLEAAGISYVGYKAAMPALEKQASDYTRKAYTAQKAEKALMAKAQTPDAFKALMSKSETIAGERLAQRQVANMGKLTKGIKGAGLFIAGTSILHQLNKGVDKAEGRHQVRKQEKRQEKQAEEEAKKRERYRTGVSFGHVDTSKIVMDLFNERIGHHKMGNSRF